MKVTSAKTIGVITIASRAYSTQGEEGQEAQMTNRELFCAVLSSGPLLRGDAIVLLAGEDAEPRLAVAVELMRTGGAPKIVVTGGLHEPPRLLGAESLATSLLALGVAPDRIIVDREAKNTHEQAVNVVAMAKEEAWGRILLVASPYHSYRAYLTFVQAIREAELTETLHVVNAASSHTSWFGEPAGATDMPRTDLLACEFEKIAVYADDVATFDEGLAYLRHWEGK